MNAPRSFAPLAFLVAAMLASACGSGAADPSAAPPEELPPDEIEAIPFSTTHVLDASELATLTASPDGKLAFAVAPASLATIAVGEVIVAGITPQAPQGLLRVVTGVKRDGAGLELTSMHAPLQCAFRKLHVKLERAQSDFVTGAVPNGDLAPRDLSFNPSATLPLDLVLFDGDGDASTKNDQVSVHGSIGGGIRFGIAVDVDWGEVLALPDAVTKCLRSVPDLLTGKLPDCSLEALLPEVKVGFHADPHMATNVKVDGSASFAYGKDFDIATIPLAPIPIGPLVFLPSVDITARVEGGAAAGFTVGAHGAIELTSSVAISSKHPTSPDLVPLAVKSRDFQADGTQVTLNAHAKVGVGARLNVQLYGIVGPYAEARTYAEVKADLTKNPCWDLHVGLEGDLGFRVTSPVLPILGSVTLVDWKSKPLVSIDQTITSGTCLPVPKGPQLPPGSGPDATSYGMPSFVPWARTFEDVGTDGKIHAVIDDLHQWSDLALAIDGRWVSSGSSGDGFVKFDDAGQLVWSRRYRRDPATPLLDVIRSAPTSDAAMVLLAEANDGEGPSLVKVGQAGGVYFRRLLALPTDSPETACTFQPSQLVRDAADGFWIAGDCAQGTRFALLHLDADGHSVATRLLGEPGGGRSVHPTAIAVSPAGDVVVVGTSSTTSEGTSMFAVRVADAGAPKWGNRYLGCAESPDLLPNRARIDANDGVTFAGSAADHRVGLLGRLKSDGQLAFANFPGNGRYAVSPMPINAFAELPTTGFLVAGSTANLDAATGTPEATGTIVLQSLDAVGRPLWSKSYRLPNDRTLAFADLHLTEDGGAVVAAAAEHVASGTRAGLFTMKVFARDGDLGQAGKDAGIVVADVPSTAPACVSGTTAWNVVATDLPFAVRDAVATVVEPGTVR